jgi:hypothetical protein
MLSVPNRESRSAAPNAAYPAPVHLYPLIFSSAHLHDCADEMIGRAIDACFGSPKRTFAFDWLTASLMVFPSLWWQDSQSLPSASEVTDAAVGRPRP